MDILIRFWSSQRWSLAVALLLCGAFPLAIAYCPQGSEWIEYNGQCYYWSKTVVSNWFKAELTCQKSGGHLVSIGSQTDNNFLLRLTQCRVLFWVGMVNTNHSLKGQIRGYEWFDHRQHVYTMLLPRTNDHYDCVLSSTDGRWVNYFCQDGYSYVCMAPASRPHVVNSTAANLKTSSVAEQPGANSDNVEVDEYALVGNSTLAPPTATPSPQRCSPGWQLLDHSCYYVSFNKTNYFNAQMSCQAMGATVTSILTPREHTLLTVAIGCNSPTWIGLEKARPCFKQPSKDHCWVWMDRSPVAHFEWASGQILDRRDAECVILDGQWKVTNCYAEYGYICKRLAN